MEQANIRSELAARLEELEARVARIEADLAAPHSADSEEQATEREQDDALEGQDALLSHEIAMISAALKRIDEGSYGDCARCGEEIGEKRLAAMPEAALCIDCARETQRH
ncbi:MAG: TraR/DksA C4-type zinc finger protein [Sphingomonadales bacterium]|nr:TraR/DksA C4-type zinc finger protein [Sphingomonadales bacterium]MBK9433482.1 TraR/DksA C4-type zinc finger protein [Sphingomonadales bacterium]MBL0020883.1 TraR/DksA C4-type zinc finger protein [Sphingomonadales bacterium]